MKKNPDSSIKTSKALVFITNKLLPASTTLFDKVWEKAAGNEIFASWMSVLIREAAWFEDPPQPIWLQILLK